VDDAAVAEETEHVLAYIADWGFIAASNAAAVEALVESWNPEYIITGGDNKYGATMTSVLAALDYYGSMVTQEKMYPGIGNHDTDDSGGIAEFLSHFPYLPGDGRNYDVVLGNVHFFFREAHDTGTHAPTEAELTASANWLQQRLSASTARWKVVVTQDPPRTSSPDTNYPGHEATQLTYEAWGAHLGLSGDSHQYERFDDSIPEGIPWIICGLGGAPKDSTFNASPVAGSQVRYAAKYGALKLRVTCSELTVEFYNTDFELIDSLNLSQ
jgi:tartrate-resistant acid phosphatase type 5